MQLKIKTISAIMSKARSATFSKRPKASVRMPACGCPPVFGHRKLKNLSQSIKALQVEQEELQCGIDNLAELHATECEAMATHRTELICRRQELQQQVEQLQQQLDGAAGVIVQIQVLSDSTIKCSVTAVQLQHGDPPAYVDVVAPTGSSCPPPVNEPVDDNSQMESAGQGTSSSSDLDTASADANCTVVLVDSKLHEKVKGVRTYSSKLADWCKKALVISNVPDTTSSDTANKVSSRWRGSSHNGRRSSLLEWGSAFTSFRNSSSVSSC